MLCIQSTVEAGDVRFPVCRRVELLELMSEKRMACGRVLVPHYANHRQAPRAMASLISAVFR